MKLHQERGTVERGGIETERQFTIKTTAKAFDILSSGLYSDNIQAIIRELSCNAYDSHVEAGKADEPFEIHMPNSMEPYFQVKDFGTGLSEADTLELYTTYFESTKTDSNDYIGALGLGSKSPFSYTNKFEVATRWNGMRYMFGVFLNDEGIPTIAKMGEIATDETNGLEVKFTVKKDDYYSFRNKTESVLMYFPTLPTVIGCDHFEFTKHPATRFEGDGWYVSEHGWNNNQFTAIQGNVPYRVNVNKLAEHMKESEVEFFKIALVSAFFEIGELEVAASREEIRYNDRTVKTLVEKARQIRSELTGLVEEKITDLDTKSFWCACIQLDELSKELFGKNHLIRRFVNEDSITNPILKRYVESSGSVFLDLENYRWYETIGYVEPQYASSSQRLTRQGIGDVVNPSKKIAIMEMDMRVGGVSRAAAWMKEQRGEVTRLIVFKRRKDDHLRKGQKDTKITPAGELKKIRKALGNPKVLKISSLPLVRPVRTYARTTGSMFTFNGARELHNRRYRSHSDKADWIKSDLDADVLEEGGLYFVMRHGTHIMAPKPDGKEEHMEWNANYVESRFKGMIGALNKHYDTEYKIEDIKGISALHAKKVKGDPNWTNIFVATRELVPHYQDAICHQLRLANTSDTFGIKDLVDSDAFRTHVEDLDDESNFRKAIMPMYEGHEAHSGLNGSAKFLQTVDAEWGVRLFTGVDGDAYFEDSAFNVYPMLSFVGTITLAGTRSSYHTPTDLEVLFDYIKQCDESVAEA